MLEPWAVATFFRGCAFLNIVPEVPDGTNPLRREARVHYDRIAAFVRELAEELIGSDSKRYGHLEAETLTDDYMTIFAGTVALTGIYQEAWPVKKGIAAVRRLVP